ncbi:MAG: carboxyl transferase domain-containing protein [Bdellovibrionota bacterium]
MTILICGIIPLSQYDRWFWEQQRPAQREKVHRNLACQSPEGYRKALRIMRIADRFKLPIVTLIDTPGAYPGVGAEERGQAEAIAKNIMVMMN